MIYRTKPDANKSPGDDSDEPPPVGVDFDEDDFDEDDFDEDDFNEDDFDEDDFDEDDFNEDDFDEDDFDEDDFDEDDFRRDPDMMMLALAIQNQESEVDNDAVGGPLARIVPTRVIRSTRAPKRTSLNRPPPPPSGRRWTQAAAAGAAAVVGAFLLHTATMPAVQVVSADEYAQKKTALLRGSQHDAWFFGASMHITAFERRPQLRDALARGTTLHFCISDPAGVHFPSTAASFGQSESSLEEQVSQTIEGLQLLYKETPVDQRDQIQLRTSDHVFSYGEYAFDTATRSATMLRVPHAWGLDAPELPSYAVTRGKEFDAYFSAAKDVWNSAEPVDLGATYPLAASRRDEAVKDPEESSRPSSQKSRQ